MADEEPKSDKIREAVGVFHDAASLEAAIDALESSGFDHSKLSLLAGEDAVAEKLGHKLKSVGEAEDDPEVPRAAYIPIEAVGEGEGALMGGLFYVGAIAAAGAVVATGGTVGVAIASAALAGGTGGVIGSLLARWLDRHHAQYLQDQIDRGGLLLWVRTETPADEKRACDILGRLSAEDVHVHDLPHVAHEFEGGVSRDMSFMKSLGL